jgi:hypothetical protein
MRSKSLIAGTLCLLSMTVLLAMSGRSQKPEEQPKFEIIEIGTGGSPKWSPDGTRLAFLAGGWLCVAEADGKGDIKKVAEIRPNSFEWMGDSSFVMSEKRSWGEDGKAEGHILAIKTVDMKGQVQTIRRDSITVVPRSEYLTYPSTPLILRDGTVGYYEIHEKPAGKTKMFKTIREGKLKPDSALMQMIATTERYPSWGEIWLESVGGAVKKKITPGREYLFPKLSPNGTNILASYGPAEFVLDLEGNVILDLGEERPEPPAGYYAHIGGTSWSPDGKRILYNVGIEDGHSVYDQDIYILNIDGTGKIPIAVTPQEKEGRGAWSPDGRKIAYLNATTGKILVVKLK